MSMVDVHFSNGPIRINTDLIPDYTRDYIAQATLDLIFHILEDQHGRELLEKKKRELFGKKEEAAPAATGTTSRKELQDQHTITELESQGDERNGK